MIHGTATDGFFRSNITHICIHEYKVSVEIAPKSSVGTYPEGRPDRFDFLKTRTNPSSDWKDQFLHEDLNI
jgi:hypothetical protein